MYFYDLFYHIITTKSIAKVGIFIPVLTNVKPAFCSFKTAILRFVHRKFTNKKIGVNVVQYDEKLSLKCKN